MGLVIVFLICDKNNLLIQAVGVILVMPRGWELVGQGCRKAVLSLN